MDLATKLQLKPGHSVDGVGVPDALRGLLPLPAAGGDPEPGAALLVFVIDRAELEMSRDRIVAAAAADRLTWVAYPKSGQLGTDLNRDVLAALLTADGIQPVRQVAVDEIWSALRFRPESP